MICTLCGSDGPLHTHHVDWDHQHNSPGNLLRVCLSCHLILHRVGELSQDELLSIRRLVRKQYPDRFPAELFD